jgi:lipopolysaccharide/colanic/teichoic acid biosynthesis glycosyltransferase
VKPQRQQRLSRRLKRLLDICAAALLLLLTLPLQALIALAIRLLMGGPVRFRQERLGLNEQIFTVWKFRTMTNDSSIPDDRRLTPLGVWLRKTSLDELPQLLNILRGEMSFVGSRPLLVRYGPFFRDEERRRHSVVPGLTGWAQIHGRNHLGWDRRLTLDGWYADNWSLRLDAAILLRTLLYVSRRQGVETAPSAVMDDLDVERAEEALRCV